MKDEFGSYVISGYDLDTGSSIDYSDQLDLIYVTCPYEVMLLPEYQAEYLITKSILPFHVPYSLFTSNHTLNVYSTNTYNTFWKIFIDSNITLKYAISHHIINCQNLVVTGYPKLDSLYEIKKNYRIRKKVIFAFSFAIKEHEGYPAGSFLHYARFITKLPTLFPEIDFVFRPHPLLKFSLMQEWGEGRTEKYFKTLLSHKNITLSTEGDYSSLFMNSDALIHDCESFLAGYLYTFKPVLSIHQKSNIDTIFSEFGKKCFECHYYAKSFEEIINFIQNTVINGVDPLKEKREKFAKEHLMVNYPNAGKAIVEYIKDELNIKK